MTATAAAIAFIFGLILAAVPSPPPYYETEWHCLPWPGCTTVEEVPLISERDGHVVLGIPIEFAFAHLQEQYIADPIGTVPRVEQWLKDFEADVEKFINDAFGEQTFEGCVRFRVDLTLKLFGGGYDSNVFPLPKAHAIGLRAEPGLRSMTYVAAATGDPTRDSPHAFEFYSTGEWAFDGMTPRDYSHEVMHLLGLGDDYRSVYDMNGEFLEAIPLPGREGTLMDTGTEIDQELVDRLGKMLREAGRLPNCYVAEAPTVRSVVTTAGGSCSDVWRMDLTFLEAADGTAEGDGTATLVSGMSCEPPVPGQHSPSETFRFAVEGKRDGDAFALTFPLRGTGTVGVGMYAVWNFDGTPRTPLTIPTDGDRSVEARWENSFTNPDGSIVQYETSGRFTLECRSCPPAVG